MLEDIAVVTGGRVISEELGLKLEKVEMDMLGQARRIVSTKENTTIVEGKGSKEEVEARVSQIKKEIETAESFDQEKLRERLAKLAGGVAVLKIGAATEVEQKARQHKIEDALAATKAAVEEGIVPGGGVTLLRCVKSMENLDLDGDEETGLNILRRVLEEPIRIIAQNAGLDGAVVAEEVKKREAGFGFNASTLKYDDLMAAGIVDPKKVVRSALQHAASAASMFLTTECVVAEKKEEKPAPGTCPSMPGGMPGMGGF